MFNQKELLSLGIAAALIGYLSAFLKFSWLGWLGAAGLALIVLLVHFAAQKFVASLKDCNIELNLWTFRQYWFYKSSYSKWPIPAWLLLPLLLLLATFGVVKWLAVTTFEAVPVRKVTPYSELSEWELAIIAASGAAANILLAVLSQFAGWQNFALLNIWFAFFNLLPISSLDGAKILFGGRVFWIFLFVLTTVILILLNIANLTTTALAAAGAVIICAVLYYFFYEA